MHWVSGVPPVTPPAFHLLTRMGSNIAPPASTTWVASLIARSLKSVSAVGISSLRRVDTAGQAGMYQRPRHFRPAFAVRLRITTATVEGTEAEAVPPARSMFWDTTKSMFGAEYVCVSTLTTSQSEETIGSHIG